MAMPLNVLSALPVAAEFLTPDDRVRASLLVDYERGGVAIGDPSQGLRVRDWEARLDGNAIQTRTDGTGAWTTVTTDTGITELALAFDQNMRPSVAYVAGGVAKLYWYDAVAAAYVTTSLPGATSPVVTMDDKRDMQIGLNDVLLFYLQGGRVKHRRQRDRYTIEYDLADVPAGAARITRWGMTVANRVQLEFGPDPGGTVDLGDGPVVSALHTDLLTDTLYAVQDDAVLPLLHAGSRTGRWRSQKFILSSRPSLAWVRVNGPFSAPATVRLYGDGALVSTTIVTGRTPVRLPARRARIWEVEVEGAGNVVTVTVASSTEELRDV